MNILVPFIQHVAAPLMPVMGTLVPTLAASARCSPANGDCTVAAFAVSVGLIGTFCVISACWMHARLRNLRYRTRLNSDAAQVAHRFREALLTGAAQGVVILRSGEQERQYFGAGETLYEGCMDSPQAGLAVRAMDCLTEDGTSFVLSITIADERFTLRGMPVAGRAVLYFHSEEDAENQAQYRALLETLPVPVWMRGIGNAIGWANSAFLSMLGFASLDDALTSDTALEWYERDLAADALERRKPTQGRASLIVNGESRQFSLDLMPMSGGAVAGLATDITEHVRLESQLRLARDTQDDMIERIPFPVAVFDGAQKLASYNSAYAELWDLAASWLDSKPFYGEILDRLRDKRYLPEQRDFAKWKLAQLFAFSCADQRREESWHLPGGKSIRIVTQPHLQGGVFILLEDITERLRLEASLNLLTQVQKATLDTLDEGIAIFGPDGRLVLHNALFANMWKLSEGELARQPHFAEIASLCTDRIGRDGIWGIVSCGVNSAMPERFGEWSKARRADGRIISLALSRLPNGATVVAFTDITDLEKFAVLQNDPEDGLITAHS